eukprot:SAG31_NODE_237_length_19590_cov_13.149915_6_plen_57_part_00
MARTAGAQSANRSHDPTCSSRRASGSAAAVSPKEPSTAWRMVRLWFGITMCARAVW